METLYRHLGLQVWWTPAQTWGQVPASMGAPPAEDGLRQDSVPGCGPGALSQAGERQAAECKHRGWGSCLGGVGVGGHWVPGRGWKVVSSGGRSRICLELGKEFRGGCVESSGQGSGLLRALADIRSPTLWGFLLRGVETGCGQQNCRPGASLVLS